MSQALDEIGDIDPIRSELEPELVNEYESWSARVTYDPAAVMLTMVGGVTLLMVTVLLYI